MDLSLLSPDLTVNALQKETIPVFFFSFSPCLAKVQEQSAGNGITPFHRDNFSDRASRIPDHPRFNSFRQ